MKAFLASILVANLLLPSGCVSVGDQAATLGKSEIGLLYKSLDGTRGITCSRSGPQTECGLTSFKDAEQPFEVESIHSDCSNSDFLCVSNLVDVFAVPRKGLTANSAYEVAGARVGVERCYIQTAEQCTAALLYTYCTSSRCREVLGAGERIGYFFFDRSRGVTAFTSSSRRLQPETPVFSLDLVGSVYVVAQDKGFLAVSLNLPQAIDR
jgi:hypothetical protein